jgi:hypothetical protein
MISIGTADRRCAVLWPPAGSYLVFSGNFLVAVVSSAVNMAYSGGLFVA